MGKVVVFDSGLGSLSIIQAIRKTTKADIVYFADQKNYPYGKKTRKELYRIITNTIQSLNKKFKPDVIIVGSNTPTLLFPDLFDDKTVMGVLPPLMEAQKKTKTNSIAVLGTTATINSKYASKYIKKHISKNISVTKIDASKLIDLVESAKFFSNKQFSEKIILQMLCDVIVQKNIDVVILSSTHLPFLLCYLEKLFPKVMFLDPAEEVANHLTVNKSFRSSKKNSLQIFSSSNTVALEKTLRKLKITHQVVFLDF
ncbi:MAG: aspartate/glutamate racemase family protein [Nitrososphaerota archaeon]|nr:aspartate/glutamate racemase family protein [Nitrososphaerota archaeon]